MEDYNGDYYGWLTTTAQALADGHTINVNLAQVAEELQDLSKTERRTIQSHFRRILIHLLKARYQPGKHTRSWDLSIEGSRLELHELLQESPSLAAEKECLMISSYRIARIKAAEQTGLDLEVFPQDCPFSITDVLPE